MLEIAHLGKKVLNIAHRKYFWQLLPLSRSLNTVKSIGHPKNNLVVKLNAINGLIDIGRIVVET